LTSGSDSKSVRCMAAQWTEVENYVGIVGVTKHYRAPPGVVVDYQYFSAGVPPFWSGTFQGDTTISLPAGFYTSLQMKPSVTTDIYIYATS
jgi:hypothetical protein